MRRRTFLGGSAAATAIIALQGHRALAKKMMAPSDPLLDPWPGAYATPPFDRIAATDIEPGLTHAMDIFRGELAGITATKDAANFANTIVPLETAGRAFNRASTVFDIHTSTLNDKAMQAVETKLAPVLAAFSDEQIQNQALFDRIAAVRAQKLKRAPDEQRLLELSYQNFARYGAALSRPNKTRLAAINKRLASLYTTFGQNQLADEEGQAVTLATDADRAGLPPAMAKLDKVANTRSAVEPFLTYASRRDLREQVWRMFVGRGETAGAHDNRPVITELLALRTEKAKLLGFPSFAHWMLDDKMAKTPERALALMMSGWKASAARVHEEVADMQALVDAEQKGKASFKIAPWDYRYYAEKVRKAKFDLDENEIKQYLQLDKMREGMFWAANQLYGLVFTRITSGVPVYHPDVTVYEVTKDKARVGIWFFDPFAREGKRSGAWMNELRAQESYFGVQTPIVSNNANFVKGKAGAPVLISFEDARTLFHEFGHALHGLLSAVRFPSLAGTRTLRDFVEFPSQLNEHWFGTSQILEKFALHHKTGKPLPKELRAKIEKAKTFNSGFKTAELLSCAIYDLRIHMAATAKIDPIAFEASVLKEIGCPPEIVMRHRPPQFGHVFSGDGYAAGYYSYVWADTLTADAAEAFAESKDGFYDKATAKRLLETIMSVGNSIPPEEAFRKFRGRDVDTNALMRDRGFPITK
ncbi:MAG: M3 family metallopeptidase [Proteobacteria bacterium]|nr:M3 family metallopeptidase [Pseudomonadota bacterium]